MPRTGPLRLDDDGVEAGAASRRWPAAALAALACLYVAARLWRLTASCLWFDEIFGVHAARHEWAGMLRFVAADLIHPPLFYALLKIWVATGGESLLWLRLLPVLVSAAALVPLVLLARELRARRAETYLALALLAANGYLIKYAQEVRMYSLLFFLTLCTLWLFARYLNRDRGPTERWLLPAALFLVNLLLVYTHYYGWLVVFTEAAFVLTWRRERARPFLMATGAVALAFAPWAWAVFRAAGEGRGLAQNIGWVARPGPLDVAQFVALLHEPFYFRQSSAEPLYTFLSAPVGFLLYGAPLALLVWRTLRRDAGAVGASALGFLLAFCVLPVVLAFAASWLLPHSVWGTRHLVVAAAPYTLLASAAFIRARPRWLRGSVLALLAGWVVWGALFAAVRREGEYIWCAWERLARQAAEAEAGAAGPVRVYAFEDLVAYHLWFALGDAASGAGGRFRVSVVRQVPGLVEDPAYFLPRGFDEVGVGDPGALDGERFWVAFRDATLGEERPPLGLLKAKGFRVERVFEAGAPGARAYLVLVARAGAVNQSGAGPGLH